MAKSVDIEQSKTKKKKAKDGRGGCRPGSGRKHAEDPRIQFTVSIRRSQLLKYCNDKKDCTKENLKTGLKAVQPITQKSIDSDL